MLTKVKGIFDGLKNSDARAASTMSVAEHFQAFLTGSYAYGTPTAESDIDLVIRLNENEAKKVFNRIWEPKTSSEHSASLYIDKLNLIVCYTNTAYLCWKRVTLALIKKAPVTRDEAIEAFKAEFVKHLNVPSHDNLY